MLIPAELFIKLDLSRLRENLARLWGRPLRRHDVDAFLIDAGFRPADEGWVAHESRLIFLDPSEIISTEPFETEPFKAEVAM